MRGTRKLLRKQASVTSGLRGVALAQRFSALCTPL